MSKYLKLKDELANKGTGQMKVFGNSMMPIIKSGTILFYERCDKYIVGDIVFCKVRSRWIAAHRITATDTMGRYMISNNKGFENGWTKQVFGKVIYRDLDFTE